MIEESHHANSNRAPALAARATAVASSAVRDALRIRARPEIISFGPDPRTMRMCFTAHEPAEIDEGMRRLAKVFA